MSYNYKVEETAKLAAEIKAAGFRVFLAERGTYGFYTDAEGSRVVSFQYDLCGFKFSGNYKAVNLAEHGRSVGTGWAMGESHSFTADGFREMLNSGAPQWATRGLPVKLQTLTQHLATYQSSSKYVEFTGEGV